MAVYKYRLNKSINGLPSGTIIGPKPVSVYATRRLSYPYWTTPLHPEAPLAGTSTDMVSRLVAQFNARTSGTVPLSSYDPPYNTDVATGNYSMCIYEVSGGTVRQPVYSTRNKYYTDASTGTVMKLQDTLDAGVPLPDPTQISDGTIAPSGTDGSIIIIDKSTNEEWELWQIKPAADGSTAKNLGYNWQCTQAGYMKDYRFHPGWWSGSGTTNSPRGGDYGVSASGFSYLGVILTGADFLAEDIKHPLTLAVPITGGDNGSPALLRPATRNDEFNFTPTSNTVASNYRIPEGARFRLDPVKYTNSYITSYAATRGLTTASGSGSTAATLAKILRCLRDYGFIIGDSAGVLGWSAEHNKTYGGPYNPIATRPTWGDFGQQIPYADLLQVQVPTIQFHTPGSGPSSMPTPPYDFSLNPINTAPVVGVPVSGVTGSFDFVTRKATVNWINPGQDNVTVTRTDNLGNTGTTTILASLKTYTFSTAIVSAANSVTLTVRGPDGTSGSVSLATSNSNAPITLLRVRNTIQAKTNGNMIRPAEARKKIVVRNLDTTDASTSRSVELCYASYTTNSSNSFNIPTIGWIEIPAGQELIDTANNSQVIWVRTKSGNTNPGTPRVEVYAEVTV